MESYTVSTTLGIKDDLTVILERVAKLAIGAGKALDSVQKSMAGWAKFAQTVDRLTPAFNRATAAVEKFNQAQAYAVNAATANIDRVLRRAEAAAASASRAAGAASSASQASGNGVVPYGRSFLPATISPVSQIGGREVVPYGVKSLPAVPGTQLALGGSGGGRRGPPTITQEGIPLVPGPGGVLVPAYGGGGRGAGGGGSGRGGGGFGGMGRGFGDVTAGYITRSAGFDVLDLLGKETDAASEYAHELNILKMNGLHQVEIANAVAAAWANTKTVITSTVTSNLAMLVDMKNVLSGGLPEAIKMLPIVSKIAAVMAASSESSVRANAGGIAFAIAKAMDIMALNTPKEMKAGAEMMSKVVTAFQNKVSPQALANTVFYMRQARYGLDKSFMWGVVPSMILERSGTGGGSGGSKGIGPSLAAVNRVVSMGIMNKKTAWWFHGLGLLGGTDLKTTTRGTMTAGLRDQKAWISNPFFATWAHLVPAMQKKYGAGIVNDPAKMRAILETSSMTQTAMAQFMEWVTKPGNILRDMQNVGVLPELDKLPPLLRQIAKQHHLDPHRGALGYTAAFDLALRSDPGTNYLALASQWTNFKTAAGISVIPAIIAGLTALTNALNWLAGLARQYPRLAEWITLVAAAFAALAVVGGTILIFVGTLGLLATAFGGISVGTVGLITAAIIGLGAAFIVFWGDIKGMTDRLFDLLKWIGKFIPGLIPPANAGVPGGGPVVHHGNMVGQTVPIPPPPGTKAAAPETPHDLAYLVQHALHGMVMIVDGEAIGRIVSEHQAKEAARPPSGPSGFDSRLSPAYPTGGAW